MGRDLAGNDALAHVIFIRQAQVLRRCNVAQEVRAGLCGDGAADGRGDMVVTRCNVGNERPEDIERRSMAKALFHLHIGRNLVHRHMAGALDHNLHVLRPRTLCKIAQLDQLADLTRVGRIINAARTQCVTQRNGNVVAAENVQHLVVILEERILIAGHLHPREQQRAAAGDDIHFAALTYKGFDRTAIDTRMNGHEVHTLLGVRLNNLEEILCGDLEQVLFQIPDRVVHRHGADHRRRHVDQLLAEGVGLAVVGQVHDGLRAHVNGHAHLAQLHLVVLAVTRNAEIDIDLYAGAVADRLCGQAFVIDVRRNRNRTLCDSFHDELDRTVFLFGDRFDLRRDDTALCGIHLRCIISHGLLILLRNKIYCFRSAVFI